MGRLTQTTMTGDGRVLMFAEYGPADGLPVLSFHGTPQCRLRVARSVGVVAELGIRLISYDRPGCGGSDRMAGRIRDGRSCRYPLR
jgi:pimeloyl-ACP methyl ester carboxylesterase